MPSTERGGDQLSTVDSFRRYTPICSAFVSQFEKGRQYISRFHIPGGIVESNYPIESRSVIMNQNDRANAYGSLKRSFGVFQFQPNFSSHPTGPSRGNRNSRTNVIMRLVVRTFRVLSATNPIGPANSKLTPY